MRNYLNGFIFLEGTIGGKLLVVNENKAGFKKFFMENQFDGLCFENQVYYNKEGLEFLSDYTELVSLEINQVSITDLSELKYLNNLQVLVLISSVAKFDFKNHPISKSLRKLVVDYHRKISNIHLIEGLEFLTIEKPSKKIQYPPSLKQLIIRKSNDENLESLNGLDNLEAMELFMCNKLNNISILNKLPSLTELEIDSCKNILDFSFLLNNESLKQVVFRNLTREQFEIVKSLEKDMSRIGFIY